MQTPLTPTEKTESDSSPEFEASGTHLLLNLSGCSFALLNDEETLRDLAQRAARATGASVLQMVSHRFSPQGVTVLLLLAESHASLHTYPESGVLFWDCFTCGQECKPELGVPVLVEALGPKTVSERLIQRGQEKSRGIN